MGWYNVRAGACCAIFLVAAAAAAAGQGSAAGCSTAAPGLRQHRQLWEGTPLHWKQRQLAAAAASTQTHLSSSSTSVAHQASGSGAGNEPATASATDWIALLSEATAVVTTPQLGQVFPAQSAAGAVTLLDGSASTPERGGSISSYNWVVRSLVDGRVVREAQGSKVELLLPPGSYKATLTVSSSIKTDSSSGQGSDTVPRFTVSAWSGIEQAAGASSAQRPDEIDSPNSSSDTLSKSSGPSGSNTEDSSPSSSSSSDPVVSNDPVDYTDMFRPWLYPSSPMPVGASDSSSMGGSGSAPGPQPEAVEGPATAGQEPPAGPQPAPGVQGPATGVQPDPAIHGDDGGVNTKDSGAAQDDATGHYPAQGVPPAEPAQVPAVEAAPKAVQQPPVPVPAPAPEPEPTPSAALAPQPQPVTAPSPPPPPPPPPHPPPPSPPPPPPPPPPPLPPVAVEAPVAPADVARPVVQPPPPPPPPPPPSPPPPVPPPPPPPSINDTFCNPDQDYDLADLKDWTDMKSCCDSAARASVVDPECASLPAQPAPRPPPAPAAAPVPPPAPAGPTVDESYCDPNADYNLGTALDWDDMNSCCEAAREKAIQDSQCSSLPPRPAADAPTPAPAPSGAPQVVEDYCVGSDYNFSKQEDRDYWQDCCSDASSQNVADTECQNPQW